MQLDGKQQKRLQQILLQAFPTLDDLRQMVFFGLSENLIAIVGNVNLNQAIFELLVWAHSRQKEDDLINAALDANSQNRDLQEFAAQVLPKSAPRGGTPGGAAPGSAPSSRLTWQARQAIVKLLTEYYGNETRLRELCRVLGVRFSTLAGADLDERTDSLIDAMVQEGRVVDLKEAAQAIAEGANSQTAAVVDDATLPYLETRSRVDEQVEYVLSRNTVKIGRALDNDIVIDNSFVGWQTVSQYHVILIRQSEGFLLNVVDSASSTSVNGAIIKAKFLTNEDIIALGKVEFIYRIP